jgi:hypothetical protein
VRREGTRDEGWVKSWKGRGRRGRRKHWSLSGLVVVARPFFELRSWRDASGREDLTRWFRRVPLRVQSTTLTPGDSPVWEKFGTRVKKTEVFEPASF